MTVAHEELEQVDRKQATKPMPQTARRGTGNSGPLQGFNDPATRDFKPLSANTVSEQDQAATAKAFRTGTVDAQRRQAQEQQGQEMTDELNSKARIQQYKALLQGKKAKKDEIPTLPAISSQDAVAKTYKMGWQAAQETIEDLVLPTLFLADLVLIPMYFVRWIGGNMMNGVTTMPRDIPGPLGGLKVSVRLVPGYSLADPLDYMRHIKFLLLVLLPVAILGFIALLLYILQNWTNINDPVIRGAWSLIINTLPKF